MESKTLVKSKTFWGAIIAFAPALWTFVTSIYPDWKVVSSEEVGDSVASLITAVGAVIAIIGRLKAVTVIGSGEGGTDAPKQ